LLLVLLGLLACVQVIGSTGGFVYILDEEGNDIKTLKPHTRAVTAIFVDSSGQTMISCSEDRSVAVIDLTNPNEQENVMHFNEAVTAVCFAGTQDSKNESSFALGSCFVSWPVEPCRHHCVADYPV
jgi:WD40 repeat protein